MESLDLDLVKHALKTAQDHGFAEVELGIDEARFSARFEPGQPKKGKAAPPVADQNSADPGSDLLLIKSPIVGYFQSGPTPLHIGDAVGKGDIVGIINALGIANDVESQISGELVEVLVNDGESVEFGQVLAKVKG